jgi:hypothetical protein
MLRSRNLIRAEHFNPNLTALLLLVLDEACADFGTSDPDRARVISAALCAMARAGQHAPDRLRRFAQIIALDPQKYRPG